MSEIHLEVHSDTAALVAAAAALFVETVVRAQQERGSASVALTGGGTGIGLLEKVCENPGAIDWRALDIWWGDERYLPTGDPERNEVQARAALLDHVDIDTARVHPMAASDGEFADAHAAAVAYEEELAAHAKGGQVPVFDVHLLGMGGEGHVNSLFPDTDAVREEHRYVVAVTDSPKPPPVRITLTLPAIQQANEVWLVVSGDAKAEAVAAAVGGASPVDIPASGARGRTVTRWLLDSAAASQLPK
ncbi:6-phosphogluconolactonase [Rhodococcus sp. WMMA185]|uniref:6-phosphogluconolactonase n=1 Tax=Rhodococcus sp. WMMA185 TaxID=679318 RepID=UPI000878380F|nr:6-phosphogluconolactonase [Rhodococcus sp. WMMA185]AOW92592.1 6-phosphogluconolactonase [Rhodococcus sp. WMMA185]